MNFLERWFDIYPDGGSGSLELLYLVVMAVGVACARWAWSHKPRQGATASDKLG